MTTTGAVLGAKAIRHLQQLRRLRDHFHWTATRVGAPGCAVRLDAQDNVDALDFAIARLSTPTKDRADG